MPATQVTESRAGGRWAPSPAGPAPDDDVVTRLPPSLALSPLRQALRFAARPVDLQLRCHRELGELFSVALPHRGLSLVGTSHPDHVRSLMTAAPADAPSMTPDSPLRPILGPNSVRTTIGPRHLRQRRLLLPPFHGEAIGRYAAVIETAIEAEIDRWPIGQPFALVPRMQAVTLDVILAGVFGMDRAATRRADTVEGRLRQATRRFLRLTAHPAWLGVDLSNLAAQEPRPPLAAILAPLDRALLALIRARRASGPTGADVLSLLLAASTEDGEPLSDRHLRDELLTLLLAGHETTANTLAWAFERLLRTPAAYDALREVVRGEDDDEAHVEATVREAMRVRPVVPMVGRTVMRPWQLGPYRLAAGTPVMMSAILLHHREDVYPDPHAFRPERFVGVKPGTYTWLAFGGGIRRCLGAALAMAEQRIVLRAIARRTDLVTARPEPEGLRWRNVTMIPARGGEVVLTARRTA